MLLGCDSEIERNLKSFYDFDCQAENRWHLCTAIAKQPTSKNPMPLIYYFHGAGGSAQWQAYSSAMRSTAKVTSDLGFSILSPSLGPVWFALDPLSSQLRSILEKVEKEKFGERPIERILIGDSMGAFNAFQFFKSNPKFASKIAFLCPAFDSFFPSNEKSRQVYLARTQANAKAANTIEQYVKRFFKSKKTLETYHPVSQLKKIPLPDQANRPELFLSIGTQDDYGFFSATNAFQKQASQLGWKVHWHPVEGGLHCAYDQDALNQFLGPTSAK